MQVKSYHFILGCGLLACYKGLVSWVQSHMADIWGFMTGGHKYRLHPTFTLDKALCCAFVCVCVFITFQYGILSIVTLETSLSI